MLQIFRDLFKKKREYFVSFKIDYSIVSTETIDGKEEEVTKVGTYWGNLILNPQNKLSYDIMEKAVNTLKENFQKDNPNITNVHRPIVISIYEY